MFAPLGAPLIEIVSVAFSLTAVANRVGTNAKDCKGPNVATNR